MRDILLTREDHIAFLQKKAIHKHIYPKIIKSIAIHLMSITSKVITSYLAYHADQSIWEKHISMAYDTNAVYDTKMHKWYLTSMCLVLEWSMWFLATLMALVLFHVRGTWEHSSQKSLSVYVIQSSCEQQLAAATYSTSVVDWATLDCLREDQETSEDPKNWQVPEVDFLLTRHPAKSASKKRRNEREEDAEYHRPSSKVYQRYLRIRLTSCRCEVLSDASKWVHRHTKN
jgi:hypothetical protein